MPKHSPKHLKRFAMLEWKMSADDACALVDSSGPDLRQMVIKYNLKQSSESDKTQHPYFDTQKILNGVDMPADSHNPHWLTVNARGSMEGVADFKETIADADTMFPDNLGINPHLYKCAAAEMIKTAPHCFGINLERPTDYQAPKF